MTTRPSVLTGFGKSTYPEFKETKEKDTLENAAARISLLKDIQFELIYANSVRAARLSTDRGSFYAVYSLWGNKFETMGMNYIRPPFPVYLPDDMGQLILKNF